MAFTGDFGVLARVAGQIPRVAQDLWLRVVSDLERVTRERMAAGFAAGSDPDGHSWKPRLTGMVYSGPQADRTNIGRRYSSHRGYGYSTFAIGRKRFKIEGAHRPSGKVGARRGGPRIAVAAGVVRKWGYKGTAPSTLHKTGALRNEILIISGQTKPGWYFVGAIGATRGLGARYPWMYQRAKKWPGARHFLPTWEMSAPTWRTAYEAAIQERLNEAGQRLGK